MSLLVALATLPTKNFSITVCTHAPMHTSERHVQASLQQFITLHHKQVHCMCWECIQRVRGQRAPWRTSPSPCTLHPPPSRPAMPCRKACLATGYGKETGAVCAQCELLDTCSRNAMIFCGLQFVRQGYVVYNTRGRTGRAITCQGARGQQHAHSLVPHAAVCR